MCAPERASCLSLRGLFGICRSLCKCDGETGANEGREHVFGLHQKWMQIHLESQSATPSVRVARPVRIMAQHLSGSLPVMQSVSRVSREPQFISTSTAVLLFALAACG